MDPKFFGLNETIGRIVKVPADQNRLVAVAVALAVASYVQIPSPQVKNPMVFFADQVFAAASEKISTINESVCFGAKAALDYAQTFWKLRYYAAHPADYSYDNEYRLQTLLKGRAAQSMDLTTLWAGGASFISQDLSEFMNKYQAEILTIAAKVGGLLRPVEPSEPVQDTTGVAYV